MNTIKKMLMVFSVAGLLGACADFEEESRVSNLISVDAEETDEQPGVKQSGNFDEIRANDGGRSSFDMKDKHEEPAVNDKPDPSFGGVQQIGNDGGVSQGNVQSAPRGDLCSAVDYTLASSSTELSVEGSALAKNLRDNPRSEFTCRFKNRHAGDGGEILIAIERNDSLPFVKAELNCDADGEDDVLSNLSFYVTESCDADSGRVSPKCAFHDKGSKEIGEKVVVSGKYLVIDTNDADDIEDLEKCTLLLTRVKMNPHQV